MEPLIKVDRLTKKFDVGNKKCLTAVNEVSFDIYEKETFGLIGESGSGKSTVGRCMLNLIAPTSGQLIYNGTDYYKFTKEQKKAIHGEMQMVFQDPHYSLNPRKNIWNTVEDTLRVNKSLSPNIRHQMTKDALDKVRLTEGDYDKYAHQLSAGQQQRLGIARAMASHPKFVVLDEPTSSLDVSIRAEIIDLLKDLQEEMGVSYLFISHDLSTIQYLCHRVAVMYLGSVVEYGTVEQLFNKTSHPYSLALLDSVMSIDGKRGGMRYKLSGEIPSAIDLPKGCPLASRCPLAKDTCRQKMPDMTEVEKGHFVKCHFADEIATKKIKEMEAV